MSQELTNQIDIQMNVNPTQLILDYPFKELDDSKLKILGEKIALCKHLQKLDLTLEENKFTENGVQHLATEIQKCEGLVNIRLNLSYNYLNNQSATYLSQSLAQLQNLKKLHLDLSVNGISDGISKIGEIIVQNQKVEYLNLILSDNPIRDYQAQHLSQCISQSQGIKGIVLIFAQINYKSFFQFKSFKSEVHVGNIGFQSLIESLTQSQSLEFFKLVLIDNEEQTNQEQLLKFGQAISKNTKLISFELKLSNIPRDDKLIKQLYMEISKNQKLISFALDLRLKLKKGNTNRRIFIRNCKKLVQFQLF
ncbi:hypothetical protein ABPG74_003560 [Tetrahymena malaccensis]